MSQEKDIFRRYLLEEVEGVGPNTSAAAGLAALKARTSASVSRHSMSMVWRYISITAAVVIAIILYSSGNSSSHLSSKVYSTTTAQRANVTLADGSSVVLAPLTKLTVTGRNVELQGEAIFTVNEHNRVPFTVKTGSVVTRVLGTRFGIKAYGRDIRVAVSNGKVAVGSYTLAAGNVAVMTDTSSQVIYNANVAELLSWTNDKLVFRNALVSEVLPDITRWYGIRFRIADSELGGRHINTTVSGKTISDEDLRNLAESIGATLERDGQTVVLRSINR